MKSLALVPAVLALWLAVDAAPAAAKVVAIKRCGSVISAPGSYTLGRSLVGTAAGAGCIQVTASNVTLDLGGYNIDCGENALSGIVVSGGAKDVTIRNGTISHCLEGISADGATALWIEEVMTVSNSSHGIRVGANSTVIRCLSYGNVGYGIMAQCPSNLIEDVAAGNYNPLYLNGAGCDTQDVTPQ